MRHTNDYSSYEDSPKSVFTTSVFHDKAVTRLLSILAQICVFGTLKANIFSTFAHRFFQAKWNLHYQ